MADRELLLMSGNAHPVLAEKVAEWLNIRLVLADVDFFPDQETRVKIIDDVREQDLFVLQPTGPPANQNVMETLVMMDALRRASAGRITAVTPYFGYARQDRKDESRVPISAKLVANLFEASGAKRLLAIDLHAAQIQGFTDLPFDHLYAAPTLRAKLSEEIDNPVFVAPDITAVKKARAYAERSGTQWAGVDKRRIDGQTTEVTVMFGHDVAGRNAILIDDMVTTGSTFLRAAEELKKRGALEVVAAATHGVLCGDAVANIEASSSLDRLYITDTLPLVAESPKIHQVSIVPLLAEAISNIHEGKSVSCLF